MADSQLLVSSASVQFRPFALTGICHGARQGGKHVLMLLVPAYIATILTYMWVLWPVAPPAAKLTEGLKTKNIFFVHDPVALGSAAFVGRLAILAMEPELVAEALKLAHIRRVKASRFKAALIATVAAYAIIIAAFFVVGR